MPATDDLDLDLLLPTIEAFAEQQTQDGQKRISELKGALNSEYKKGTELRGAALMLFASYLRAPTLLHYLGINSLAIVEVHGLLEHFVSREFPKLLADESSARSVVASLCERRVLADLGPHLVTLGIWNEDDWSAIKQLKSLRDAIVHNNVPKLAKLLGGDAGGDLGDIRILADEHDARRYIAKAPGWILKLSRKRVKKDV